MSTTAQVIPGYVTGTWDLDPVHTEVGFSVRHLMVSKVRGRFTQFSGSYTTAKDPAQSSVEVEIDLSSVDTGNEQRDGHLKSSDFFQVEAHPTMTYRSTGVRQDGDQWIVAGELTIKGITRPVALTVEPNGFGPDPYGGFRSGFSATGEISRKEFGIDWNAPLEAGGVVVGDKVQLAIEVEGILRAAS